MGSRQARSGTGRPRADLGASPLATAMYAAALTWWAVSWNLRNSVLMSWSPVEPVWVGSVAVALCVVHRFGRPLRPVAAVWLPLALLVVTFLPGATLVPDGGYGPTKLGLMATGTLPILAAAVVLLDSARARAAWVGAQVACGIAVAVAALELNGPSDLLDLERLTLQSVDTISTGRLVGAASVLLLLVGLASSRHRWWAWPTALVTGMVLVQVGSRGPLTAVVLTLFVTVLAGRFFAGRRGWPLVVGVLAAVAAYVYAVGAGGAGGRRIADSVQGGLEDDSREQLLVEAFQIGGRHPFGVGWGTFADHSATGASISNAQGAAYAHNVFAETFAEGGVLALVGFAVLTVLALVRLRRHSDSVAGLLALASAVYWLLNAQFSTDVVGNRLMWIALACGVAAHGGRARRASDGPSAPGRSRSPDGTRSPGAPGPSSREGSTMAYSDPTGHTRHRR